MLSLDAVDNNAPFPLIDKLEILHNIPPVTRWEQVYHMQVGDSIKQGQQHIQPSQSYWFKIALKGSSVKTDSYMFQVFSGDLNKNSWNYIKAWLVHPDARVDSQKTGIAVPKHKKPFPYPLNLLSFEIEKNEEVSLIIKLEGPSQRGIPGIPKLYYIPKDYYKDKNGVYEFSGDFSVKRETTPVITNWLFHQEIYEDPAHNNISFIQNNWTQLERKDLFEISPKPDIPYWLKVRILGSPYFKGNTIFQLGEYTSSNNYNLSGFDTIQAFIYVDKHIRPVSITGSSIRPVDRPWKHWAQYLKLDIPEKDTVDVFIRVKGSLDRLLPNLIQLFHVDESSMWDWQVNEGLFHGLFYGILIIQFCYFFLLYWVEHEFLHLYLSFFVLGLLLIFGFGASARFIILPFWRNYHLLLFRSGFWLSILGLLMFTQNYFQFNKESLLLKYVLPCYLLMHAIVCYVNSFSWGFLPRNTILLTSLLGLILNFSIVARAKKVLPKFRNYYLLAFSPLFILMVIYAFEVLLLTYGIIGERFTFGFDLYNGMKISTVMMLVLLALSAGGRTNKLKADKTAALEKGLKDQERINQAISRFVPNEFLNSLNKKDLTQISLGDSIQKEVTVLFSDIRSYTSLAEQMTPEENFKFVNAYNGRMGPVIRQHSGFVNQYLGDGIMAIFPQSPDDALRAAINMQKALRSYNEKRKLNGREAIQAGIGLHSGLLIMGIIGDGQRMDAATISDTVNTASRVEGLSKYFASSILLSDASLANMHQPSNFNLRFLGKVEVKGKKKSIGIFECFDGDPSELFAKKKASLADFDAAVKAYFQKSFTDTIALLEAVLTQNPDDQPARIILEKAKKYQQEGTDETWTGVEVITQK